MKPIRRRLLGSGCALVALAAAGPRLARAQPRTVRIGVLSPRRRSFYFPAVLKRLGELGYVEGKNLVVDYRSADGVAERMVPLARELVQAKCDLIIAVGPVQTAQALLEAKVTVPSVIVAVDYDPVEARIVSSAPRPGGNITGMFVLQSELAVKRLELMREFVPKAMRFLILADRYTEQQLEAVRQAAQRLRVEIVVESFAAPPYQLEPAFEKGRAAGAEGVMALASPVFADLVSRTAELALSHRWPSAGASTPHALAGILFSYGLNPDNAFVRAGDIAASILKGAKPGEIALEQPTHYELAVSLKTAKALGLALPPTIMARVNRLIE
jgi:putative ABC transport system substrate-binding protein